MTELTVLYRGLPHAVLRETSDFGLRALDLVHPPRRFWGEDSSEVPVVVSNVDARRVTALKSPIEALSQHQNEDLSRPQVRRSVARLAAWLLLCEDPQRRLDARKVETLAHQVSLVRHVLASQSLARVMIADEVGLGKTVEVGLLLQELFRDRPGLRVLYLAPARLVSNVAREFDRIGLGFREWKAVNSDARIESDSRIIASIHRAVHSENFDRVINSPPWDVLIVDECHHLSDWAPGGGDPVKKFRLVRQLSLRQAPDARLILLSGTPHQGHQERFRNLIGLLGDGGRGVDPSIEGRVIYRTKEDVQDWDGAPLFPLRQVNDPIVVDLGHAYTEWLYRIHDYFKPPKELASEARRRGSAWRCAQALQWAASSPQAGLGYLVRQCIRSAWSLEEPELRLALGALRPYRLGSADEPISQLYDRIAAEIRRQNGALDLEDIEELDVLEDTGERAQLAALLLFGVQLVDAAHNPKWERIRCDIIEKCGDEKVVLFAQPIETVTALAQYLERVYGVRPALIIGGQSEIERDQQVANFVQPSGPKFLISSKAGGEGLNLQVSRRLVHVDVPWNPMEMEQRVGRVHRYGSKETIIVDTLVVRDSREADAWRVARRKLELVARSLVPPDKFDAVFRRVMCLVPPEELQSLLLERAAAPLSPDESDRLSELVEAGFRSWSAFHAKYSDGQRQIQALNPGIASWSDLREVLIEHCGARPAPGFRAGRFIKTGEGVKYVETDADVLELSDGECYFVGGTGATILGHPNGRKARPLGLNVRPVAHALRGIALGGDTLGVAFLRWPESDCTIFTTNSSSHGLLIYARVTVRAETSGSWLEVANDLLAYIVSVSGSTRLVDDAGEKRQLLSGIMRASVRLNSGDSAELVRQLKVAHEVIADTIRTPNEADLVSGQRYAVLPLLVAVVYN